MSPDFSTSIPRPFAEAILPAVVHGGFRRDDAWIWCGSVIRGEDERYHMFASMWEKTVPFTYWVTNSMIVHAVADTPEGPFHYKEDVLTPRGSRFWDGMMTHNPTIHRFQDRYLLFYTGTTYEGERPGPGLDVPEKVKRQAGANQRIGMAVAPSPDGPWQRPYAPCLDVRPGHWDAQMTTNPAPCIHDTGDTLLLYKSKSGPRRPTRYGVARASTPFGPFGRVGPERPIVFGDASTPYEDAYVWFRNGMYHMLFNDLKGVLTGEDHAGAYALSIDGIDWRLHPRPRAYSRTVTWSDGTVTTQGSLERPQLLIEHGRPTHLYAATADGPGGFEHAANTWNMVFPLQET
jgi:hypothetical protein